MSNLLKELLLVMTGGGIGSVARYFVTNVLKNKFELDHWATFWVNITGCFLIGLLFHKLISTNSDLFIFVIVGMIGSYTTFSAFEYENIDLIAHEKYLEFLKYATCSCGFSFLSVLCGFYIAKIL